MKQALMFLALGVALSAPPLGAAAFTLIAGTSAIMKFHPEQALAKLHQLQLARHS
jgi:hypothetical protein